MKKLVSLAFLFFTISCSPQYSHVANDNALAHIKSNLEFLASDELEGREATRAGSRTAAKFLATKLNQFGYAPAGDSGTYFQEFDLKETNFLKTSGIAFSKESLSRLEIGPNFIPFAAGKKITDSEIIFVGFGITDTLLNYDDYAGLDVTGKTVIAVFGVPVKKDDPDYFKEGRRWLSSSAKTRAAADHGAAAIIILQSNYWAGNWQGLVDTYLGGNVGRLTALLRLGHGNRRVHVRLVIHLVRPGQHHRLDRIFTEHVRHGQGGIDLGIFTQFRHRADRGRCSRAVKDTGRTY